LEDFVNKTSKHDIFESISAENLAGSDIENAATASCPNVHNVSDDNFYDHFFLNMRGQNCAANAVAPSNSEANLNGDNDNHDPGVINEDLEALVADEDINPSDHTSEAARPVDENVLDELTSLYQDIFHKDSDNGSWGFLPMFPIINRKAQLLANFITKELRNRSVRTEPSDPLVQMLRKHVQKLKGVSTAAELDSIKDADFQTLIQEAAADPRLIRQLILLMLRMLSRRNHNMAHNKFLRTSKDYSSTAHTINSVAFDLEQRVLAFTWQLPYPDDLTSEEIWILDIDYLKHLATIPRSDLHVPPKSGSCQFNGDYLYVWTRMCIEVWRWRNAERIKILEPLPQQGFEIGPIQKETNHLSAFDRHFIYVWTLVEPCNPMLQHFFTPENDIEEFSTIIYPWRKIHVWDGIMIGYRSIDWGQYFLQGNRNNIVYHFLHFWSLSDGTLLRQLALSYMDFPLADENKFKYTSSFKFVGRLILLESFYCLGYVMDLNRGGSLPEILTKWSANIDTENIHNEDVDKNQHGSLEDTDGHQDSNTNDSDDTSYGACLKFFPLFGTHTDYEDKDSPRMVGAFGQFLFVQRGARRDLYLRLRISADYPDYLEIFNCGSGKEQWEINGFNKSVCHKILSNGGDPVFWNGSKLILQRSESEHGSGFATYDFLNQVEWDAKKFCFRCQKIGHQWRYCIQRLVCFLCKEEGHKAKECPDKVANSICFRCKQKGHLKKNCKNPVVKSPYIQVIKCWKCEGMGHKWGECESPLQPKCYKCSGIGHIAEQCPSKKYWNRKGEYIMCFLCRRKGHVRRNCPNNWRNRRFKEYMDKCGEISINEARQAVYGDLETDGQIIDVFAL